MGSTEEYGNLKVGKNIQGTFKNIQGTTGETTVLECRNRRS